MRKNSAHFSDARRFALRRYIELFRSTPEQMNSALMRAGKSNNLAGMAGGMGPPMHAYGGMGPPMHAYGGMGPGGYPPPGYGHHPAMGGHPAAAAPVGGVPGSDAVIKMRGLPYKVRIFAAQFSPRNSLRAILSAQFAAQPSDALGRS